METTITQLKSNFQKLKKVLMIAALIGLGSKANAQCSASFTWSANPANNGEVTFNNTSSGSTLNYVWYFGDSGSSTGASPTHTYATSGTYTVCLYVSDSLAPCQDSTCTTITVTNSTPPPPCHAEFSASTDSSGYTSFYDLSTGSATTYAWNFGDGTSQTAGTGGLSHHYSTPGTYYACLSISNFLGTCTDTYCDTIVVTSPTSCLGSVTTYFTAHDSSGIEVFSNGVTGTGPVYHWDFGDGITSSAIGNTTHVYSGPGTYLVCLTVYETGGMYDSCQYCSYVTIGGGSPTPCDASYTIVQDTTDSFNYFVYNNSTGSGTATYFWDFGDGATSTLQYPTHTYSGSGPYNLCLTVTDSTPMITCTNTFCDSLAAGRSSTGISVTVVNPSVTTGIHESAVSSSVENYPNPFNGSTTITYSISKDASVELNVFDFLGNKVAAIESTRKSAGNYSVVWNANDVAAGMYLLQMKVNNTISTKKIILNK